MKGKSYGIEKTSHDYDYDHDHEKRSTACGFHGVFGHRMELETVNRYEMNVTSLLDIMV